jgi:hypothetical protein
MPLNTDIYLKTSIYRDERMQAILSTYVSFYVPFYVGFMKTSSNSRDIEPFCYSTKIITDFLRFREAWIRVRAGIIQFEKL